MRKWLLRCWLAVSLPCTLNLVLCLNRITYLLKQRGVWGIWYAALLVPAVMLLLIH